MIRGDLDRLTRRALMRLALGRGDDKMDRMYGVLSSEGLIAFDESGDPFLTPGGVAVVREWIAAPPIAWTSFRRGQGVRLNSRAVQAPSACSVSPRP